MLKSFACLLRLPFHVHVLWKIEGDRVITIEVFKLDVTKQLLGFILHELKLHL